MLQFWKTSHIIKGMLTRVPLINSWRLRRATTQGSDSPRYCYSVWFRHLVTLHRYGFNIVGARIGELGPGDSIGIGLTALLSGAEQYVGLDVVPFSAKADLDAIFQSLVQLYSKQASIPDNDEFPRLRPQLDSYSFPEDLVAKSDVSQKVSDINLDIKRSITTGRFISYQAPWMSRDVITTNSLDLVFSQAVLEHVDDLDETYEVMYAWLKPGGYASHVIDFGAHHLAPYWNGHWAYSELEWKLVRGRREYLLNREPLSAHLTCIDKIGFEVLSLDIKRGTGGLPKTMLSCKHQQLDERDLATRGAMLILRKPLD